MWQIDDAPAAPPDVVGAVARLAERPFFDTGRPLTITRAPGRLDLMGGISDYSGALVLELPLALAAVAAAQPDDEPALTVRSARAEEVDGLPEVRVPLALLAPGGRPAEYAEARAALAADPAAHWAAYVAGVALALAREAGAPLDRGARVLIDSAVPPGKGVSSSAAIEVAAIHALAATLGVELDGRRMAILCQMAENLVVGAPCGVMDQMTSACGRAGALLALRCQPAELEPPVALPGDLEVWGIDSGIRHAVSGADYGSVRIGAFMGYRVVADLAGLRAEPDGEGRVRVEDPLWGGYLANIPPSLWAQRFAARVPESMRGDEFLARYGGTTDPVTRVDPGRTYAVRQPAAHPIHEHHRVLAFRELLRVASGREGEQARRLLGELMYQSHASYSTCGLGSEGTDRLVELVRDAGPREGLYGAKITGGGSGGTVAVLARRGGGEAVAHVAARYAGETGRQALLIGGSSDGAVASGVFRARWRGRPLKTE
jgi:L-arabinokinase